MNNKNIYKIVQNFIDNSDFTSFDGKRCDSIGLIIMLREKYTPWEIEDVIQMMKNEMKYPKSQIINKYNSFFTNS